MTFRKEKTMHREKITGVLKRSLNMRLFDKRLALVDRYLALCELQHHCFEYTGMFIEETDGNVYLCRTVYHIGEPQLMRFKVDKDLILTEADKPITKDTIKGEWFK